MFRFSIRELMLVTLVVAVSVGWAIDHWRPGDTYRMMGQKISVMEEALKQLGYAVKEEWPGVVIERSQERPWIRDNESLRPGERLMGGGPSPSPTGYK
jgi:hypothetical protein